MTAPCWSCPTITIIIFNSIIIIIVVFFLLASTADWIELLSLKEVNAQRTPVLRCAALKIENKLFPASLRCCVGALRRVRCVVGHVTMVWTIFICCAAFIGCVASAVETLPYCRCSLPAGWLCAAPSLAERSSSEHSPVFEYSCSGCHGNKRRLLTTSSIRVGHPITSSNLFISFILTFQVILIV